RAAARAAVAIARGEMPEGAAGVNVPVVPKAQMTVEIHRVLEPCTRRIPRLPMIAVQLRPIVNPARVPEGERGPRAPVDHIGAAQIPDVVHLESGRLPQQARLETCDAATVLPELDLLFVTRE